MQSTTKSHVGGHGSLCLLSSAGEGGATSAPCFPPSSSSPAPLLHLGYLFSFFFFSAGKGKARATEAIAVCVFAKTHVVEAHVVAVVAERRPTTTSMTDVIRSMLDVEQRQASMLSYDVCICLLLHLLLFLLLLLAPPAKSPGPLAPASSTCPLLSRPRTRQQRRSSVKRRGLQVAQPAALWRHFAHRGVHRRTSDPAVARRMPLCSSTT